MIEDSVHKILTAGSHQAYLFFVFMGLLSGSALIRHDSRTWVLPTKDKWSVLLAALYGSLLGAALPAFFAGGYVGLLVADPSSALPTHDGFFRNYLEIFAGPKTVVGGMLLGFVVTAIAKKVLAISYDTSDAFARGTCLMMAMGRIGCIFQHCCFGRETSWAWGHDFGDGVLRIPVQVVEAVFLFSVFIFINYLHKRDLYPGRRLFIFFAVYGAGRFGLEMLREPIASVIWGVGFYQYIAAAVFITGIYQLWIRSHLAQQFDPVEG